MKVIDHDEAMPPFLTAYQECDGCAPANTWAR